MMVTDCANDIKYLTGESGDGIASAGLNFSNKLGLSLRRFICRCIHF